MDICRAAKRYEVLAKYQNIVHRLSLLCSDSRAEDIGELLDEIDTLLDHTARIKGGLDKNRRAS